MVVYMEQLVTGDALDHVPCRNVLSNDYVTL